MAHQPSDTEHEYCRVCGVPAAHTTRPSGQTRIQGQAAYREQPIDQGAPTNTVRR